jgi:hypothetical protein
MTDMFRKSPVSFDRNIEISEIQNGFKVVTKYENEGAGPFLVDLSHKNKWDIQDADLFGFTPFGISVPSSPGQVVFQNGVVVNRMNDSQAAIWHLLGELPEDMPEETAYTETTDGLALLALVGKDVVTIMETLSDLDLQPPEKTPPFLLQGPVLDIPCQIVVMGTIEDETILLLAFSRGYGQAMAEAILDAGKPWGLRPGGQSAFDR